MTNARIADMFEQIAALLETQDASPHRVRAWLDGARAIREHPREMADVFRDHGRVGLEALPHIGHHLSAVIIELLRTGRTSTLDRLRGETAHALERVPGIGHELAERVHEQLGIETLEDLEVAAHDGRLATVEGFGPRRVAMVKDVLASRLRHAQPARRQPPIALLLDLDAEYREAAAAGELRKIAPRRFNPSHDAWLPIQHVERDGWTFTLMFSNTALAHQLGRTGDWVVVYFHERGGHDPEAQSTIVTERSGRLRGLRVVRGRERECADHYDAEHQRRAS